MTADVDPDLARLQGVNGWDWRARIVCCDVEDLKRRHVCRSCEIPVRSPRVYCSKRCELVFDRDHFWAPAKARALRAARLDGRDGMIALELVPTAPELTIENLEALIRGRRREVQAILENSYGRPSRIGRVHAYLCARCRQPTTAPEVNHIVPVVGGNRSATCMNHEENLEVLCHSCHVPTTKRQAAERRAAVA
jgi:5-methylcytosine-specific restriction endonuclease McrA